MVKVLITGILFWSIFSSVPVTVDAADTKPQRIVSINICSDEILLRLADHSRIAGVTDGALDEKLSSVVDLAQGIPTTYGTAEEILLLNPDLVIAGAFYTRTTVDILRKLGINVKYVKNPRNFEELKEYIIDIAQTIGEEEKARVMIQDMEARLRRIKQEKIEPINTIFYWPGGVTAGSNTLISAIMEAAGAHNIANDVHLKNDRILDLENLVLTDPDMVIVSDFRRGVPTVSREFLSHPILRKKFPENKTIAIPLSMIFCGSPANVEAVELLAKRVKKYHLWRNNIDEGQ